MRIDTISVINVRQFDSGSLRASADVQLGDILIKGFRVVQQPNQRAWISPPQREWVDENGKKHFAPIVTLSGRLKAEVEAVLLSAWNEEKKHDNS